MPDEYDVLFQPANPRERVHRVASRIGISPDIAEDFVKVVNLESGASHYDRAGRVKRGPVTRSGDRAIGATQIMPKTAKAVDPSLDPFKEDDNYALGLRYFAEGGNDPTARRLHYFGGPGAARAYRRSGRIPRIDDRNLTATQYVQATGGGQRPTTPYDALFSASPEQSPQSESSPELKAKPTPESATSPIPGQAAPSIEQALILPPGQRNRGAAYRPKFGRGQVAPQPVAADDELLRQLGRPAVGPSQAEQREGARKEAKRELESRRIHLTGPGGRYTIPSPTGLLAIAGNPLGAVRDLFKSDEEQIGELTAENLRRQQIAAEPEVKSIRQEYGQMSAPVRSAAAPVLGRGGGGLLKIAGGLSSAFGILPNQLSDWINRRGEIVETASMLPPLKEERGLSALVTGEPELKEVERGLPEKIATGFADLGVGLAQVLLLKRATGLRFNQLLALEAAARNSNRPVSEQLSRAAEGYALGTALDRHMSRPISALIGGAPTGVQTGYEVAQGRMSPLDAAIQTGIQTAAGAILTSPRAREETPVRESAAQPEQPRVPLPAEMSPTPEVAEHNQQVLSGGQFRTAAQLESVGGNAGDLRAAVNVAVDSSGRIMTDSEGSIITIGHIPDLPAEIQAGLRDGSIRRATATVQYEPGLDKPIIQDIVIAQARTALPDYAEVVERLNRLLPEEHQAYQRALRADPTYQKAEQAYFDAPRELTQQAMQGRQQAEAAFAERYFGEEGRSEAPQKFYHRDFGEVTASENQTGVGKRKVRVTDSAGNEHVIQRTALTGRGNERAVPVRIAAQKSQVDVAREARGAEPLDRAVVPKADVRLVEDAAQANKADPTQPLRLAEEVLGRPRALSDQETVQLDLESTRLSNELNRLAHTLDNETDPAVIRERADQMDAIERDLDKLDQAYGRSGTEKGRSLRAQRIALAEDYSYAGLIRRAKRAKGRELTSEEQARYKEESTRISERESRLDEAKEKDAAKEFQRQVNRRARREQRTQTRQALDEEFVDLRAQFAQARAETKNVQASGLAGLDPEGKLTKLIAQMARNRIRAGVTDATQLVDDVYEAVREHLPTSVTRRDLRDAISGYERQAQQRQQSPETQQLARVRSELRQLSTKEDVASGKRLSAKEKTRQTNLRKQEAALQRKLDARDFAKPPTRERPRYTAETARLERQVEDLKRQFNREMYRATRSTGGKISDTLAQAAGVPKTFKSIGDISAVFRQGGYYAITHPVKGLAVPFRDMVRSFSDAGYRNVEQAIKDHPKFRQAQADGVEFTGVDRDNPRLSAREEGYLGSDAIDTLARGRLNPLRVVKGVKDFSERTFVSFLDSQRLSMYDTLTDGLANPDVVSRLLGARGGLSDAELAADRQRIARAINSATGRGNLGARGNQIAPVLNIAMFSPRLLKSRIELLNNMFNPVAIRNMPRNARAQIVKDNAKFIAATMGVLALAKALGAEVGTNPDDADFLKIRVRNTTYDTLTGLQQPLRAIVNLVRAATGGETYPGKSMKEILDPFEQGSFTRTKLSPVAGVAVDAITGKTFEGKKFSPGRAATDLVTPLPVKDFIEAMKQEGVLPGALMATPALTGIGVQSYPRPPERPTTHAEKLARKFIRDKLPDEAREDEEIETSRKLADLRARIRKGENQAPEVVKMITAGEITPKQGQRVLKAAGRSRLSEDLLAPGFTVADALTVYSVMSADEKRQNRVLVLGKLGRFEGSPQEHRKLIDRAKQLGVFAR